MERGAKKKRVARGSKKRKRNNKKKGGARDVVADLTDDVLVDILSRVPVKSLCRCKSVCRRWRDLISHPDHRKKLPQTLAGFFYGSYDKTRFPKWTRHFVNLSGRGDPMINPSLSFLPEYERIDFVDSCNGLLLCRGWKSTSPVALDYLVCNPATEKWVVVPDSGWSSKAVLYEERIAYLGFDPAVSTHFHVFEFIPDFIPDHVWHMDDQEMDVEDYHVEENHFDGTIQVVATYSSQAGVWSYNGDNFEWSDQFVMPMDSKGVFFNGVLHLTTVFGMVLAIDVDGNILRGIPVPMLPDNDDFFEENLGDVYLSQGHLYFAAIHVCYESDDYKISVWVLEDYTSETWSSKHNVNIMDLSGGSRYYLCGGDSKVISIHPEHNVIFMVCGSDKTLICYEMDHRQAHFVSLLGSHCSTPYIPYVPLFSGSLADEH